jgi:branched-chain amino acid transport system substrate-binding protein
MAEAGRRPQPAGNMRWRLGVLVAAMLVAGCQTIVPRGERPPTKGPDRPTQVETPITPGLPDDQERHRIALLVPMTGANAAVGQSIANAANLAVLDTGGQRIRITMYDTALGAAAAAQKAVAEGNRVILGPLLSEDVAAVAPVARRANVPLLSFSNDATVAGNGVYLLGYSPAQAIERVVGYARSRGVTSFAGLMPNGTYGQRASTAFIRAVEGAGGRVVGMQNYDRSQRSIAAAVTRLGQTSSYDALLIADSGGVALQAAPLIRKSSGPSARFLGTELWNTEPSLSSGPILRGAWFASVSRWALQPAVD